MNVVDCAMSDITQCKKGHTYNAFVNPHCPKCSVRGDLE